MRVMYLANIPRAHLTGAALRTLKMARGVIARGEYAVIAAPPGCALERQARSRQIPFRPVTFGPGPGAMSSLRAAIRAESPDILHAMSAVPLVLAQPRLLLGKLGGLPRMGAFVSIVVDPRSSEVFADNRPKTTVTALRNALLRQVAPALDAVFPVSNPVADALRSLGVRAHIVVSGSMIEVEDLVRRSEGDIELPPGRPRIGSAVGQLEKLKGVDFLIRAFAQVATAYPEATLLVAAEGSQRAALTRLAQELGVADRVHLLGYLDDPAPFLRALDLYVSPSLTEGLASATAEASALGVPVVSTDVGGTTDIVVDGVTGLLVPPSDVEALASAMGRLMADPVYARQLGEAGRADMCARHGMKRAFAAVWLEYEAALRRRGYSAAPAQPESGRPE